LLTKAAAKGKMDKVMAPFKKYGKSGKMSRKEVQAYAKGEFGFNIPADSLDTICTVLMEDKAVPSDNFYRLSVAVGLAREKAADAKRMAVRQAREKEVAEIKAKLQTNIDKVQKELEATAEVVSKAEKEANSLQPKGRTMTASEMLKLLAETDTLIEEAKEKCGEGDAIIKGLEEETEPELKTFLAGAVARLQGMVKGFTGRIAKMQSAAGRFKADAGRKEATELAKLKADFLKLVHAHQVAKDLTTEDVVTKVEKSGKVQEKAFVKFVKSCVTDEKEAIAEDDLSRLYNHLDTEEEGFLTKEQFGQAIRRFLKVVKETVGTEEIGLDSKSLRRLEVGEVVEVLSGPKKEESAEVERMKVKSPTDDLVGWVTPKGNQGTLFLVPGGSIYKVVKETILTSTFSLDDDKEETKKLKEPRKLKVGETVEVLEFPKKEESSGLLRMKVRVKADGIVGWATQKGNTGILFLQVA